MKGENLLFVIVTGTDPASKKGGIGFVMPAYLSALQMSGILYESIPTYHPETNSGKWLLFLSSLPRIVSEIRKTRNSGVSVVVYSHAGKGLSLLREGLVLFVSRFFGAKTVLQLHAVEIDSYLKKRWTTWLLKAVVSSADMVCVLTTWWKHRFDGLDIIGQLSVISNPLPLAWEQRAKTDYMFKNRKGKLTVLTMTRLESGKGVDLVIEAMQFVSGQIRLIIAGDGSQLEYLKKRTKYLGLTKIVEFVGWVSGDKKQKLLDESDIYCLPTVYDSFGMGFLEAMANGIPMVALDWGPIGDVVLNNKTGLLIRQPDAKLLATAIETLMDDKIREQMGRQSRQWVLSQFSAQKIGSQLQNMMYHLTND